MNKIRYILIGIYFLSISTLSLMAQSATIKASIDSAQMWIGTQNHINIEVAANQNSNIDLLFMEKYIMKGIEILECSEPDTTDIGNNRMQIKYNYLITSFDENLYAIPPFKVVELGDTTYSNELALKVITLPIDTAHLDQYFDIKDVIAPPFAWKDYINYILYPLLFLIPLALIILAYFFFVKKKTIVKVKKEEPLLPPHVVALNNLDTIKSRKLWQNGKTKEYHSEITNTLRNYIERRFNINAMEMTSGEILEKTIGISDIDNVHDKFKQILLLGDLVKFAKYNALPEENELSLMNAYLFVNETKKEELPSKQEEEIIEENNINNEINN